MRPKGLLLDYGGTLVEETVFDVRAGNAWLLERAAFRPPHVALDHVLQRAARVTAEVAARRDQFHLETAWPTLTRLIHDFLGIRFEDPMPELEMGFWKASVQTRALPGAREALEVFHRYGVPMAVVSNCSFGSDVIRYELDKHGLAEHLAFVMVSAEYSVRKPNVLLFETAAARLGIQARDIWFVGDRVDTDVAGAAAAGMRPILFCPTGVRSLRTPEGDLSVSDWQDIMRRFLESDPDLGELLGQW